jgi:hypothetical protein
MATCVRMWERVTQRERRARVRAQSCAVDEAVVVASVPVVARGVIGELSFAAGAV